MQVFFYPGGIATKQTHKLETTSASLHIMAMLFMLLDHLWATVVPGNDWMTCVGRLAFPIFAFSLVEGFFHTRDRKAYAKRLLVFALLSEIPFDLAVGSRWFYPIHQNVLWTFLMALGLMQWNETQREKAPARRSAVAVASVIIGALAGLITMADYYHAGILTVLVFYFFRGTSLFHRLGQLAALWYINFELLGGLGYELSLFGRPFFFPQQGFALLALLPIWLYGGRQGHRSKTFQYFCYAFYPVHLLVLGLLKLFL